MKALDYIDWDIGEVTVINFTGRLTLGQGSERFRQSVREVLERGRRQILLNFDEVFYVDSSGLGELVSALKAVHQAGGVIKLMKLNQLTRDIIQMTRICTLFEVFKDEKSALASFQRPSPIG
jgi:anti-sigma B factor antagonist